MNILITGSSGQLGSELQQCIRSLHAEIGPIPNLYRGANVVSIDVDDLDITDRKAVKLFFENTGPFDLVFNCAAFTNVDECEDDEGRAFAVNAEGPKNIAEMCSKSGAKLVHLSTDYVFPGTNPTPRVEDDETSPLSAYGRTKIAGEDAVKNSLDRYFIVRTAWLYGGKGKNFVQTMIRLGKEKEQITVVSDQFGNPTSANDLAYELLNLALTDYYGIYHCTNEGVCSWADFAKAIMSGMSLNCEVIPISSEEYKLNNPNSASRPAFSALENAHLAQTIGNHMRPWQDALADYLAKQKQ